MTRFKLIDKLGHAEIVVALIVVVLVVLAGPLALLYRADSRVCEERPRPWFPGRR
jgi:hypothetical protein